MRDPIQDIGQHHGCSARRWQRDRTLPEISEVLAIGAIVRPIEAKELTSGSIF